MSDHRLPSRLHRKTREEEWKRQAFPLSLCLEQHLPLLQPALPGASSVSGSLFEDAAFSFPEPCERGPLGGARPPPTQELHPSARRVGGPGGEGPISSHARGRAQGAARGRPTPTDLSAAPGDWNLRECPGGARKGRERPRAGGWVGEGWGRGGPLKRATWRRSQQMRNAREGMGVGAEAGGQGGRWGGGSRRGVRASGRGDVSRRHPPHFGPAAPGNRGRRRPGWPRRGCWATPRARPRLLHLRLPRAARCARSPLPVPPPPRMRLRPLHPPTPGRVLAAPNPRAPRALPQPRSRKAGLPRGPRDPNVTQQFPAPPRTPTGSAAQRPQGVKVRGLSLPGAGARKCPHTCPPSKQGGSFWTEGAGSVTCALTALTQNITIGSRREEGLPQGADSLLAKLVDKKIALLETFGNLGCTASLWDTGRGSSITATRSGRSGRSGRPGETQVCGLEFEVGKRDPWKRG